MKVLLDTHILIWLILEDKKLSSNAKEIILNPQNEIFYSSVSIWEAQIKHIKHPLEFTLTGELLNSLSLKSNLKCLDLIPEHSFLLGGLSYSDKAPRIHKDPFDRILICQAKAENMLFLTHDELLPYYNESCVFSV